MKGSNKMNIEESKIDYLVERGYTIIDINNLEAGFIYKFNLPYTFNHEGDEVVEDEVFEIWGDRKVLESPNYVKLSSSVYAFKEVRGFDFTDVPFVLWRGNEVVQALDIDGKGKTLIEAVTGVREWISDSELSFIV